MHLTWWVIIDINTNFQEILCFFNFKVVFIFQQVTANFHNQLAKVPYFSHAWHLVKNEFCQNVEWNNTFTRETWIVYTNSRGIISLSNTRTGFSERFFSLSLSIVQIVWMAPSICSDLRLGRHPLMANGFHCECFGEAIFDHFRVARI